MGKYGITPRLNLLLKRVSDKISLNTVVRISHFILKGTYVTKFDRFPVVKTQRT